MRLNKGKQKEKTENKGTSVKVISWTFFTV